MGGSDRDSGFEWAYRDLLFNLVVAFLAVAACSILISPPKPTTTSPGGVLTIEMTWAQGSKSDVDLWVLAPDDRSAVGYSHRTARSCDLIRDDLGGNDASSRALEQVVCRSGPPGEYVVNVHMYNFAESDVHPMPVEVTVRQLQGGASQKGEEKVLAKRSLHIKERGEQTTALRFRLDDQGRLVPGSVNNLYRDVRSATP